MSLRMLITYLIIAFIASTAVTRMIIPYFKRRQLGQFIREEGPEAHLSKQGTPTMGGIAIIIGVMVGIFCDGALNAHKFAIIFTMLAFGAIGFIDDYNKIAKKNNLGLTAKQKLAIQIVFSVVIAIYMMITEGTEIFIPFFKTYVDIGFLFIPFVVFVQVAMSNSVNLTDGLDGLAAGVSAIVALAFVAIGYTLEDPLMITGGVAVSGSLLGFLIFNRYPARIFMGDTGSMALGGVLTAIAIVTRMEFVLPIAGLIYVIEALSVIIQVIYFRKTGGKRFFRMSPIHHHFELGGMKEYNVVLMFCAFTAVCSVIAYFAVV
jgi:phospho-N-acetylmuramoyl-pentapeptide-transferase